MVFGSAWLPGAGQYQEEHPKNFTALFRFTRTLSDLLLRFAQFLSDPSVSFRFTKNSLRLNRSPPDSLEPVGIHSIWLGSTQIHAVSPKFPQSHSDLLSLRQIHTRFESVQILSDSLCIMQIHSNSLGLIQICSMCFRFRQTCSASPRFAPDSDPFR